MQTIVLNVVKMPPGLSMAGSGNFSRRASFRGVDLARERLRRFLRHGRFDCRSPVDAKPIPIEDVEFF